MRSCRENRIIVVGEIILVCESSHLLIVLSLGGKAVVVGWYIGSSAISIICSGSSSKVETGALIVVVVVVWVGLLTVSYILGYSLVVVSSSCYCSG